MVFRKLDKLKVCFFVKTLLKELVVIIKILDKSMKSKILINIFFSLF